MRISSEQEFSNLHVYVYEEEVRGLYAHHDIMLSNYQLCLEWCNFVSGSSDYANKANFIIVGTFLSEIEIWNLDVMNAIQPSFLLGGHSQSRKPIKKLKQLHVFYSCFKH